MAASIRPLWRGRNLIASPKCCLNQRPWLHLDAALDSPRAADAVTLWCEAIE